MREFRLEVSFNYLALLSIVTAGGTFSKFIDLVSYYKNGVTFEVKLGLHKPYLSLSLGTNGFKSLPKRGSGQSDFSKRS